MEDKKLDVSSISFVSGDRIDTNLLLDYFMAMFPGRAEVLGRIWRWLNRIEFYNNQTPFAALYDNRVIAYFGMMPFAVSLDGVRHVATWSIDYSVLPEFQRHGLGVVLLKKWMELPDVQVGFANVRAIGACRKAGLGECYDTRLHYFLLNPFDHPRLVRSIPPAIRGILNVISRPLFVINYRWRAHSANSLEFLEVNRESLERFITPSSLPPDTVEPIRDGDYLSWRLLRSPEKEDYRVCRMGDLDMVVKLCGKGQIRYVDILLISDDSKSIAIRRAVSSLAGWAARGGYSYLRFLTTKNELSNYMGKTLLSIVRRPPFVFYATDPDLRQRLEEVRWHWQLIDSDFEVF